MMSADESAGGGFVTSSPIPGAEQVDDEEEEEPELHSWTWPRLATETDENEPLPLDLLMENNLVLKRCRSLEQEKNDEVAHWSARAAQLDEEVESLKLRLSDSEDHVFHLANKLREREQFITQQLHEQEAEQQRLSKELEEQKSYSANTEKRLRKALEVSSDSPNSETSARLSLSVDVDVQTVELDQETDSRDEEIRCLEERNNKIQDQLESLVGLKEELEQQVSFLNAENYAANQLDEASAISDLIKKLKRDKTDLLHQLNEKSSECQRLKCQLNKCQLQANKQAETRRADLELERKLAQLEVEHEEKCRRAGELSDKVGRLEAELALKKAEVNALRESLNLTNNGQIRVGELAERVTELTKDNERLRKQLDLTSCQIRLSEGFAEQMEEKHKKLAQSEQQNKDLEEVMDRTMGDVKALQTKVHRMEEAKHELEIILDQKDREYESFKENAEFQYNDVVGRLNKENANLLRQLALLGSSTLTAANTATMSTCCDSGRGTSSSAGTTPRTLESTNSTKLEQLRSILEEKSNLLNTRNDAEEATGLFQRVLALCDVILLEEEKTLDQERCRTAVNRLASSIFELLDKCTAVGQEAVRQREQNVEHEVASIREQLTMSRQKAGKFETKTNEELVKLNDTIARTERKRMELVKEVIELRRQLTDAESKADRKGEQIALANQRLFDATQRLLDREKECDAMETRCHELEQERNKLRDDFLCFREDNETLHEASLQTIDKLRADIFSLQNAYDRKSTELLDERSAVERLRRQLITARSDGELLETRNQMVLSRNDNDAFLRHAEITRLDLQLKRAERRISSLIAQKRYFLAGEKRLIRRLREFVDTEEETKRRLASMCGERGATVVPRTNTTGPRRNKFRPVAMAVRFAVRWAKVGRRQSSLDSISTLSVPRAELSHSPPVKQTKKENRRSYAGNRKSANQAGLGSSSKPQTSNRVLRQLNA